MSQTVLIVEDENIIALEISWQLENLGYDVMGIVSRGEEAILRVAEKKPDLVLMDIRLKGELDGFQTAKAITAEADIPIVYLSALIDKKMILQEFGDSNNVSYLSKPFTESELKETIDDVIGKDSNGSGKLTGYTSQI